MTQVFAVGRRETREYGAGRTEADRSIDSHDMVTALSEKRLQIRRGFGKRSAYHQRTQRTQRFERGVRADFEGLPR